MRTAIVLFNLGGPDTQAAVQPFLQNLFSDPAIIRAPAPVRWLLARLISKRRAPIAREIYAKMGGGSPILPNTQAQATALEAALGEGYKCFIVMRYWHPRAAEAIKQLNAYQPDKLVLLPLYPQFSSTTTQSSLDEFWAEVQADDGWLHANWDEIQTQAPRCYPYDEGFITAQADLIRPKLAEASKLGKPRLLLSAHGLPEKVIKDGDPYQWQCEQTAKAIIAKLNWLELDWVNCYQSRVGPLKWIGPSTDSEIERAGRDKVPVVLAPIAFVSEHSETLVELDIEYAELAHESGVPFYGRVPTVTTHPAFITTLAQRVKNALANNQPPRVCPPEFTNCRCR
jgi:protoporphyrin/coproporphyrin ferrochelatase